MDRYKSVLFAFLMLTAWSMLVINTFANNSIPEFLSALPSIAVTQNSID